MTTRDTNFHRWVSDMDPKELKRHLDWIYEGYMEYGPGHASTWARVVYEELQAEVNQFWKDIEEAKLEKFRDDMSCAMRWAGHHAAAQG